MIKEELTFELTDYASQIESLQRDEHARIVGSIGRMAIMQDTTGDAYLEFRDQLEIGVALTHTPDLDVLGTKRPMVTLAEVMGDMEVDDTAFANEEASLTNENGNWHLRSKKVGFEKLIHPAIMEPVVIEVEGIRIVTVSLLTHRLLHSIRAPRNKKERMSKVSMDYALRQMSLSMGYVPKLDQKQTRPFYELALLLQNSHDPSHD